MKIDMFVRIAMIILGHKYFDNIILSKASSINDVKSSPNGSIIYVTTKLDQSIELIKHLNENEIEFAMNCETIKEAIFLHNFEAKYIFTSIKNAKILQNIANEYLFDSKIIAIIDNEDEITPLAKESIDGIVFRNFLK